MHPDPSAVPAAQMSSPLASGATRFALLWAACPQSSIWAAHCQPLRPVHLSLGEVEQGPTNLRGTSPGQPNQCSGPAGGALRTGSSRASPGAASPWLPRTRWCWFCALRRWVFPALQRHTLHPESGKCSEAPCVPRHPGCAPCATAPAPKLANLAPGAAHRVCPSRLGRCLRMGRRGAPGGLVWLEGRGKWGPGWHLPGGSVAATSRALAGGGSSSRRGGGGSSSSSRAGQSRRRAAPAGGSMAARPQPGPRTRSRRESSPRAAQPTSGGSWSRPQLQHRRARGGGGEARRRGRGARREGGESEGAS